MKKTFGIIALFCLLVNSIGAEYNFDGSTNVVGSGEIMTTSAPISASTKEYKSSEEFLKVEGDTCTFATDGCNTHTIQDGKLGASTEKYCENIYGKNGQEKWSCLKYKEEPKVYKTSEEFLKAEGNKCETATDGCNTVMIVDGKLGGMTKMYCEDVYGPNGQEEWSCLKYKSETDMKVCTMEYAPVCGVDGNTYGNACMAGDVEVLYKGECSTYVDVAMFKVLLKKEAELQKALANVKTEVLEKALENIDNMIEGVKLSKIAAWGQKLKITQYTFIKRLIQNELVSR